MLMAMENGRLGLENLKPNRTLLPELKLAERRRRPRFIWTGTLLKMLQVMILNILKRESILKGLTRHQLKPESNPLATFLAVWNQVKNISLGCGQ